MLQGLYACLKMVSSEIFVKGNAKKNRAASEVPSSVP
jgi:hypothetical protein